VNTGYKCNTDVKSFALQIFVNGVRLLI